MESILLLIFLLKCAFGEFVNIQPLSVARYYIGSTTLTNYGLSFFAGGLTDTVVTNAVDIYNITSNKWTTAELSIARYFVAATSLEKEGLAFFAGGTIKTISLSGSATYSNPNVIDIYNAKIKKWSTAFLSVARENMATTTIQSSGTVIFGVGSTRIPARSSNVIDIYHSKNNSWTTQTANTARSGVKAESLKDIALIGGREGGKCDLYNSTSETLTVTFMSNICRRNYATAALPNEGLIFFAGGYNCDNINLVHTLIDIYDVNTNKWSIKYSNEARYNLEAISFVNLGKIMFVGGQDSFQFHDIGEVYDSKTWSEIFFNIKQKSSILSCESMNDFAFCAGGKDSSNALNNVFYVGGVQGKINSINPIGYELCPAGKYCNIIEPEICDIGSYCPEGTSKQIPCPSGTYGIKTQATSLNDCIKCKAGTYSSSPGVTISSCQDCYPGTYCPNGTIYPIQCPPNFYCPTGESQIACPSGYYYDGIASTKLEDCKICEKGFYCEGQGKSKRPCGPGTFNNIPSSSICESCPEGKFCPLGAIEPKLCPVNTYSSKGSSACTPCQSEQYTESPGSAQCLSCSGDQFQINGWWCMGLLNKVLFVSVWIGSFLSGYATIRKMYIMYKERCEKIIKSNLRLNLFNFIHIKKIIKLKEQFSKMRNKDPNINFPSKMKNVYVDNC